MLLLFVVLLGAVGGAGALAFARVLAFATVVARLPAPFALAGIFTLAGVLFLLVVKAGSGGLSGKMAGGGHRRARVARCSGGSVQTGHRAAQQAGKGRRQH